MAYFKLSLLSLSDRLDVNSNVAFYANTISEFMSQRDEYQQRVKNNLVKKSEDEKKEDFSSPISTNNFSSSYTYDEKFSIHLNAQKELTFSMDKNVFRADRWEENPFYFSIHVGSHLLLEDKEGNHYLFTVKNISYTIKENNLSQSITCQDSFTYQGSRQNDGYEIENDPSSEDFIGAKTIDWWVLHKIQPECGIIYKYIPLMKGLYENQSGQFIEFLDPSEIINLKRLIKEPYSKVENSEMYETFAFSCSGSNADAALISLGEELNLQLETFEHLKEGAIRGGNTLVRYFWYTPRQNTHITGLEYSPLSDIQDFSFSFAGDSLTSVLNVTGYSSDDGSIVSLIPDIPQFFYNVFLNQTFWENSLFKPGFFAELVQGQSYVASSEAANERTLWIGELSAGAITSLQLFFNDNLNRDKRTTPQVGIYTEDGINYVFLPIWNNTNNYNLSLNPFYQYFSFNSYTNDPSIISFLGKNGGIESFTSRDLSWDLVLLKIRKTPYVEEDKEPQYYDGDPFIIKAGEELPSEYRCANLAGYIRLKGASSWNNLASYRIYFRNYRIPSQEELDWASLADKIPYLENKIIDFNYFYNTGIINKNQYGEILNIVNNELRINNGRLLVYSKNYYEALHNKTRILADLQAKIDTIGGQYSAEILSPFSTNGQAKSDITDFTTSYSNLFPQAKRGELSYILNYDDIITDYIRKYWSARQNCLKNLYNFREFFEAPYGNALSNDNEVLYEDKITLSGGVEETSEDGLTYTYKTLGFENINFVQLADDFNDWYKDPSSPYYGKPLVDIYIFENGQYIFADVVDTSNVTNYYTPTVVAGETLDYHTIGSNGVSNTFYNANESYYYITFKINLPSNKLEDPKDYIINPPESLLLEVTNNDKTFSNIPLKLLEATESTAIYKQDIVYGKDNISEADKFLTSNRTIIESSQCKVMKSDGGKISNSFTIELRAASLQEILNNYVNLKTWDEQKNESALFGNNAPKLTNSAYIRNTENVWSGRDELFSTFEKEKKIWEDITFASCLTRNEYDEDEKESTANQNYRISFPVTDFYFKGEKYKPSTEITTVGTGDNQIVVYNYVKVNEQNLTQEEFNSIDENKGLTWEVSNDYRTINFITPANESNYYRRVWTTANTGVVLGSAVGTAAGVSSATALSLAAVGAFATATGPVGVMAVGAVLAISAITAGIVAIVRHCSSGFFATSGESVKDFFENTGTRSSGYLDWEEPRYFYTTEEFGKDLYDYYWKDTANGEITSYNLYDYMGFTYAGLFGNNASSGKNDYPGNNAYFYYKDCWLKPLGANSLLNKYDNYYILVTNSTEGYDKLLNKTDFSKFNRVDKTDIGDLRISKNIYYPLFNHMTKLDLSAMEDETISMQDIAKQGKWTVDQSTGEITIPENSNYKVYIFHYEDYRKENIFSPNKKSYEYNGSYQYYDNNDLPITWTTNPYITYGFFSIVSVDSNFQKTQSYSENQIYYKKIDNSYRQVYTIKQLVDSKKAYYLSSSVYREYNFDLSKLKYEIPVYLITTFSEKRFNRITLTLTKSDKLNFIPSAEEYIISYQNNTLYCDLESYKDDEEKITLFLKYKHGTLNYDANNKLDLNFYITETNGKEEKIPYTVINNYLLYENTNNYAGQDAKNDIKLLEDEEQAEKVTTSKDISEAQFLATFDFSSAKSTQKYYPDSSTTSSESYPQIQVPIIEDGFTCKAVLTSTAKDSFRNMNNGDFWYKYHNNLEISTLQQDAAAIESELMTYWQAAYSASLYCDIFVPQYWQPRNGVDSNYFFKKLFGVSVVNTTTHLKLSTHYVPIIKKVTNSSGSATLPRYNLIYCSSIKTQPGLSIKTTNKKLIEEYTEVNTCDKVFANNIAVRQAFENIPFDWSTVYAEELPHVNTTYYYIEKGGCSWPQMTEEMLFNNSSFSRYNGQYVMLLNILHDRFGPQYFDTYEQLMKKHQMIWRKLYANYPSVILESNYSNTDAVDSQGLYLAASNYFKDLYNPERQYNITIIDVNHLKGYSGQQLRIGDPIKVNADEYYDEYDDVKEALKQYLFISDLSYNLRSDADIGITVNTIKYQDKLLQRLVKLIKQ